MVRRIFTGAVKVVAAAVFTQCDPNSTWQVSPD
jgi:hypothetical protein